MARRADRLDRLATELREEFGIAVRTVPLDLGGSDAVDILRDRLASSQPIDAVINCAGFATRGPFIDEEGGRTQEELRLNIGVVVEISRAFLPPMIERRRGALVNIASLFAYQPAPNMAIYGATKAFVLNFTEALWSEARGSGVKVLAVSPGPTRTEFFDTLEGFAATVPRQIFQAPEQVVRATLRALDRRNTPPSITSGGLASALARGTRLIGRHAAIKVAAALT